MTKEDRPFLIMSVGCPGSGKTTFLKQLREKNYPEALYFSADEMREWEVKDGYYLLNKKKEPAIINQYELLVLSAFKTQKDIILDRTHLTYRNRKPYVDLANLYGYKIKMFYFQKTLATCIRQNNKRKKRCPEEHIKHCFKLLEEPTLSECTSLFIFHESQGGKY